jgi:hypothetical protein
MNLYTARHAKLNLLKFINSDLSDLVSDGRGGI